MDSRFLCCDEWVQVGVVQVLFPVLKAYADKVVGVDIPLHLEEQHISAHLVEQGGFHFL